MLGDSVIAGLGSPGDPTRDWCPRSWTARPSSSLPVAHTQSSMRSVTSTSSAPSIPIGPRVGGRQRRSSPRGYDPKKLMDRFAPKSWQGIEGLEPRPWFSGQRAERARQKTTMVAKLALKHVAVRATGGYRRVPPDQFAAALEQLMAGLNAAQLPGRCRGPSPGGRTTSGLVATRRQSNTRAPTTPGREVRPGHVCRPQTTAALLG